MSLKTVSLLTSSSNANLATNASRIATALNMSVHTVSDSTYILHKGTYNGRGIVLNCCTPSYSTSNMMLVTLGVSESTCVPTVNTKTDNNGAASIATFSKLVYYDDQSSRDSVGFGALSSATTLQYSSSYPSIGWSKETVDGQDEYIYFYAIYRTNNSSYPDTNVCDNNGNYIRAGLCQRDQITPARTNEIWLAPVSVGSIQSSRLFATAMFPNDSNSIYFSLQGHTFISACTYAGNSKMRLAVKLD